MSDPVRRLTARTASALVALALVACGGSPAEDLADEQADVMTRFAATVEGIEDARDYQEAQPRLRELVDEGKAVAARWRAMVEDGTLTKQELEQISKDHVALRDASQRLIDAVVGLTADPDLMAVSSEVSLMMAEAFGDT